MGLCEGPPRSIYPDPNGRADYLGDSINQAARFMDAGVDKSVGVDESVDLRAAVHGGQLSGPCSDDALTGHFPFPSPSSTALPWSSGNSRNGMTKHFPCPSSTAHL